MRSIDRRWAKEATAAGADLVVVSPYLTSQTAERILLTSKHERACPTVLTTFTTEVFATGASHLATIGRLLKGGCRVFHVDGLHAKILLAPQFASIGSQNLTQRGTRTKEASVAVVHARAIAEVRRGVERWRSLARPIDMEMVELMEREVIPLRKRMKMLQRDLSATDRRIGGVLQERAAQRAKVERRLREEKARRQEQEKLVLWSTVRNRSSGLRAEVKKAQHSLHMNVTVVHVPWEDLYGNSGAYDTMKLSNPRVDDMRHWTLDGRMVNLAKGEPILMVLEEIGRLSLVLVNKIQVTYFGYRGQFTQPLVAVNSQWYVGAHFPTRLEDLKTWNVKLILTRDAKALACISHTRRL